IRKLIKEGAAAVESENINDVMSKVSFNYSDDHGLNYLYLKEEMKKIFQRMDHIMIEYDIREMELKDKSAAVTVDLRVIATYGQDTGYFMGDAAGPVEVLFSLEKVRTKWLVRSTTGIPAFVL
ncbi:MAG: hypothetical protein VST72_01630, partial [Nitrospirota bacterium]|nr:hypothetical protein [Nitrospirota bacterium]